MRVFLRLRSLPTVVTFFLTLRTMLLEKSTPKEIYATEEKVEVDFGSMLDGCDYFEQLKESCLLNHSSFYLAKENDT